MKNGNCSQCDKPLFDQDPYELGTLCDECRQEYRDEGVDL